MSGQKHLRYLAPLPGLGPGIVRVLMWQATYLGTAPAAAEALSIWIFCKIKRGVRYGDVLDRKGIARATAYRRRDRALSIIATGLTRDGIPRGKH